MDLLHMEMELVVLVVVLLVSHLALAGSLVPFRSLKEL
jgi:hypothetical protein